MNNHHSLRQNCYFGIKSKILFFKKNEKLKAFLSALYSLLLSSRDFNHTKSKYERRKNNPDFVSN